MSNLVTGKVRFSYATVFEARAINGGEEKFSVTLLIPKSDTNTYQRIMAEINKTLQENVADTFKGVMPQNPSLPIYDGDGVRPSGEPYGPECKGHWVISAKSNSAPEVVDANLNPIISKNEFYSGCYGRASIRFYAYNRNGNKGIGCGLGNNAKFLADNGIKELATDLSEVALENVAKIEGVTTQKLDLTEPFAFADESFDIVLADLCLHYFSEAMTEKIILEIKRVLKKGGILLARVNSTADINHGAGQGEKLEENSFFVEGYNKRFFDEETAQKFFGLIGSCQVRNAVMKRYEKEKQLLEICALKNN